MRGGDRERDGDEHHEHKGRRGGDAGDRYHPHGLPMSPFGRMARKTRSAAKMTR